MNFIDMLSARWRSADSLLAVGLDPDPARFPAHLHNRPDAVLAFCRAIVDATADLVCAFKPQIAYFASMRAEDQLERLIAHIRARHPDVPVIQARGLPSASRGRSRSWAPPPTRPS